MTMFPFSSGGKTDALEDVLEVFDWFTIPKPAFGGNMGGLIMGCCCT